MLSVFSVTSCEKTFGAAAGYSGQLQAALTRQPACKRRGFRSFRQFAGVVRLVTEGDRFEV